MHVEKEVGTARLLVEDEPQQDDDGHGHLPGVTVLDESSLFEGLIAPSTSQQIACCPQRERERGGKGKTKERQANKRNATKSSGRLQMCWATSTSYNIYVVIPFL
jgi:hypothetical protein